MIERKSTRQVQIGSIKIGGSNPIAVQSMTNTDTRDVKATVAQIRALEKAGCEIVRFAVPDLASAKAIAAIRRQTDVPLVADIHFDYRLALESINNGVDKVRINPGNIGSLDKTKMVVEAAQKRSIPIRVGVNSGSVPKDILAKHQNKPTPAALVESAVRHVQILENLNFEDIVISVKASDVYPMIESYRLLSQKVDYPLHLGVTEAGTSYLGALKSAVGIGAVLAEGIGDTIRVSLTADPIEEIKPAWEILKALGLRQRGVTITSCPTCGRTQIDLITLTKKIERATADLEKPIHLAVMGCVVNGPGEAREADLGVAGGRGQGVIFKKGRIIKTVSEDQIVPTLLAEIDKI